LCIFGLSLLAKLGSSFLGARLLGWPMRTRCGGVRTLSPTAPTLLKATLYLVLLNMPDLPDPSARAPLQLRLAALHFVLFLLHGSSLSSFLWLSFFRPGRLGFSLDDESDVALCSRRFVGARLATPPDDN